MNREFAEAAIKKIRADMNSKADYLASGFAANYDEYKHVCGEIRGLALAEDHIKNLLENVEDDEDPDN